jgi:hypothetical protein
MLKGSSQEWCIRTTGLQTSAVLVIKTVQREKKNVALSETGGYT